MTLDSCLDNNRSDVKINEQTEPIYLVLAAARLRLLITAGTVIPMIAVLRTTTVILNVRNSSVI